MNSRTFRNLIVSIVTSWCFLQFATAADESALEDLGAHIERSLPDWNLPGMAVVVVRGDEVIYAQGFGVRQLGRPERIDADTRFQIGSTSKAFAAATIAALVDEGSVGWDDPVIQHLPWFRLSDPWLTEQVTVRDLLAHRSGVHDGAYAAIAIMDLETMGRRARLLQDFSPFRSQFQYSNVGYGVLGLVVAAASGMSWGEYIQQHVFEPLGMQHSGAGPGDYWAPEDYAPTFLGTAPSGEPSLARARGDNLAMPHGFDRNGERRILPWTSYDSMAPAGNVISSARDMGQWLRMQLNAGKLGTDKVLSPAVVAEMHKPQILSDGHFAFADAGTDFYALGWQLETFQGRRYISHGGGIFGFPAYVGMLPDEGIAVAVLANGSTYTPYYPHQEVVAMVAERLLGLEPQDWHGEIKTLSDAIMQRVADFEPSLAATRLPDTQPALALQDYAGRYQNELSGPLDVTLQDGQLKIQFEGQGALSGTLEHWHHDVFRFWYDGGDGGAWSRSFASFIINPAGKSATLNLERFGEFQRAP